MTAVPQEPDDRAWPPRPAGAARLLAASTAVLAAFHYPGVGPPLVLVPTGAYRVAPPRTLP